MSDQLTCQHRRLRPLVTSGRRIQHIELTTATIGTHCGGVVPRIESGVWCHGRQCLTRCCGNVYRGIVVRRTERFSGIHGVAGAIGISDASSIESNHRRIR
jgi:hypothetical protein